MADRRNRPAVFGALLAGAFAFAALWWWGLSPVLAWMAGWSIPAFAMYAIDKRQAGAAAWRVPETVLHALALVGGVVGAWAGRIFLRHKTRKPLFLVVLVAASILWAAIVVLAVMR
jgi:uncharacterized membrane protein YsdA (DUF1294 family)